MNGIKPVLLAWEIAEGFAFNMVSIADGDGKSAHSICRSIMSLRLSS
jgi:hypothetical protein